MISVCKTDQAATAITLISKKDLSILRAAAQAWVRDHPDHTDVEDVIEALARTNIPTRLGRPALGPEIVKQIVEMDRKGIKNKSAIARKMGISQPSVTRVLTVQEFKERLKTLKQKER